MSCCTTRNRKEPTRRHWIGWLAIIAVAAWAVFMLGFSAGRVCRGETTIMPEPVFKARAAERPASVNPSGVTGHGIPTPRQGATQQAEATLAAIYQDAIERMSRDVGRFLLAGSDATRSQGFAAARANELNAILSGRLVRLGRDVAPVMAAEHRKAYRLGSDDALRQAFRLGADLRLGDAGAGEASFVGFAEEAVERIARDSTARMMAAARQFAIDSQTLFRTFSAGPLSGAEPAVNRALAQGLISGDPRAAERQVRQLVAGRVIDQAAGDTYRKIGNRQVQVGGWTGSARAYAATVVRTRTREATVGGRHDRLQAAGLDLVQITGRVSGNFCTRYLGLVCSLGAGSDEHPALASLPGGGPPFHPNCSKGTAAFIPGLVSDRRERMQSAALASFRRAEAAGLLTTNLPAA